MENSPESSLVHRTPFYYGWVILAAGTAGMIMTQPGQSPVLSIFTDAFIQDLGISRSLTSTLFTVATIVAGLSLTFWGERIDRHGYRKMVTIITGLLGVSCLYMALVQNALMLGVGYVLLRMLGASALMLVSNNVINQWWIARRGTTIGLSGVGYSLLAMGAFPNLVHVLVQAVDWRATYAILGAMELFVMLPVGLLLFRDRPEDHGLEPDGGWTATASSAISQPLETNWTRAEAVRTVAFWVTAGSLAATAMFGTGLYFHMVSIFRSRGLAPHLAAAVYLPISVTTAAVQLGSGYLADRVPVRLLLTTGLVAMSSAMGLAQVMEGAPLAFAYGIAMGVSSGTIGTASSMIWADYFGRLHLGSISGLGATVSRVSSALGPLPLALAFDRWGGYGLALRIEMVIPLLLAALTVLVPPPEHPASAAGARPPSS